MGRRVHPKRFFIFKFGLSPSEKFFFLQLKPFRDGEICF